MARVNYIQTKSPTWMQPAIDMLTSEMVAHGLFSFVETVNSPGGMPAQVFKASGATSPLGRDWYVVIARTVNNPGNFYVAVAEGYDSTAKALIRPAPGTNGTNVVPATDFSYGGGAAYPIWTGTTGSTLNTADIRWWNTNPGTTIVDCWTVITKSGLYIWGHQPGRSSSYNYGCFAGVITPLQKNDPGILVVGDYLNRNQATDAGSLVSTRHPTITAAGPYNWNWNSPSQPDCQWTPSTGQVNGAGDRMFNGRPVGGRRVLRTNGGLTLYGDFRGIWPDLLNIRTSGGGGAADTVMPGETMTIYDDAGVGSSYIYSFRYSSGGNELWINTSTP